MLLDEIREVYVVTRAKPTANNTGDTRCSAATETAKTESN